METKGPSKAVMTRRPEDTCVYKMIKWKNNKKKPKQYGRKTRDPQR